MRQNLKNKSQNLLIFVIIVLTAGVCPAEFSKTTQLLTSNNIIALAGSGDTLWLATERGLNYQTLIDTAGVWHGFEDNELGNRLWGLEFGGGTAMAILYNNNGEPGFWQFDHKTGKQQENAFRFSANTPDENDDYLATGSTVYANGCFWAAFRHGGLVKYDPKTNTVLAMRPGDDKEVSPDKLAPLADGGSAGKAVWEIGVIQGAGGGDSLIWAAADTSDTSTVWTYDPVNKAWGSIDKKPADPIYEAIDSTKKLNGFRPELAEAGNNPAPEINCMLFLPNTDNNSKGTLVIGTTTGLYICRSAEPLVPRYGNFSLVKYVRPIKSGDNYALPGILRGSADGRYDKCVFVYKLKKDGNVTIKVYDYNMSLVKTVIKGKSRKKGADGARSTEPLSDVWDGTNEAGKRVWPGVYYYKITSTGGDRLFGKIVFAK